MVFEELVAVGGFGDLVKSLVQSEGIGSGGVTGKRNVGLSDLLRGELGNTIGLCELPMFKFSQGSVTNILADGNFLQDGLCFLRLSLAKQDVQLLHGNRKKLGSPVFRSEILRCTTELCVKLVSYYSRAPCGVDHTNL